MTAPARFGVCHEEIVQGRSERCPLCSRFHEKNRPAWELTVICGEDKAEELEQIIFTETTTIGIREYPLGRSVLDREEKKWKRFTAKHL